MSPKLSPSPFARARTAVIKVGSAVLTTASGEIDTAILRGLCGSFAGLVRGKHSPIVVTSGAVASGRSALGIPASRKLTIAEKQALAAVGQSRIMRLYSDIFAEHGIVVGQMLLTHGDMEDRRRYLNTGYTLSHLLRLGCLPIINENDTTTVDELKFGDNDGLAALVAVGMQAEALVLLSDVDGLYDSNPKSNPGAKLIERVERLTPALIEQMCPPPGPDVTVGSGGMRSKLAAARLATTQGVCVAIANGRQPGKLEHIFTGDFRGTYFPAQPRRHSSWRHWILSKRSAAGRRLHIDEGARNALLKNNKSLLPAGISRVEGNFEAGDVAEIVDSSGRVLGRGIVNYNAEELERIAGHRSSEIEAILGSKSYDEAIHRDNLALM
ncbi:MAG: glutamate 5-kinase [bacterium]